jgi:hypothetical protein
MKVGPKQALAFVALFAGCAPIVGTSEVELDEMYAAYTITSTDEATNVVALFFRYGPIPDGDGDGAADGEGTSDSLQVDGGDRVTVTLNDTTEELALDERFVDHGFLGMGPHFFGYTARLPVAATDDEIVVTMTRGDGVVVESSVTMPPPPEVGTIPAEFSRADGLSFVGEGEYAGDFLEGEVLGDICFSSWGSESEGPRLDMQFEEGSEECDISLVLARVRFAQGNPQFSASDIEARRNTNPITIRSTP